MHQLLSFITDLENDKDKNIKKHHKLMAASFWNFALKIAEKFFIYGDSATDYAKNILFMALHNDTQTVLDYIKAEHTRHNTPYSDTEIYDLFVASYEKSQQECIQNENKDFYL